MSERVMGRQIIEAVNGGYSAPLPNQRCRCGGTIEVTNVVKVRSVPGGPPVWVKRYLRCNKCHERKPKWVVRWGDEDATE